MNQAELRAEAEDRIIDAGVLLAGQRWGFAFYVAGYAVECGLKSCVLSRMVLTGGVFKDKKFAEQCWTHEFEKLIDLAGLRPELGTAMGVSPAFRQNWNAASGWKETSRYSAGQQLQAEQLFAAITDQTDGVMQWIRRYW